MHSHYSLLVCLYYNIVQHLSPLILLHTHGKRQCVRSGGGRSEERVHCFEMLIKSLKYQSPPS